MARGLDFRAWPDRVHLVDILMKHADAFDSVPEIQGALEVGYEDGGEVPSVVISK